MLSSPIKKTFTVLGAAVAIIVAETGIREALYRAHMWRHHSEEVHDEDDAPEGESFTWVEQTEGDEEDSAPVYTTDDGEEIEVAPNTKIIPLSEVYRNYAYDSGLLDPEGILGAFADKETYVRPSEEGAEKLKSDSDVRLRAMGQLMPLVHLYAQFGAAAFIEIYNREHPEMTDEEKAEMFSAFVVFAHSLLQGAFTGAKYLGLIDA